MPPAPTMPSEYTSVAELLPTFDFEGLIARGDLCSIYKARQRSLDREVAIKIFPRGSHSTRSCEASAKAMASLAHPNLIRVYDSGEVEGHFYIVMEYVPGKSLEHSARGKAIDPRQASAIILAVCEGLAHAHEYGIFHPRIKPSDILLTPKCQPKIGNFSTLDPADACTSPESDVFALGLILRELLTGVPSGSPEATRAIVPDLKLAAICRKATHPDLSQRFADTSALRDAISRFLTPVKPMPAAPKRHISPLHRPKPALVVSGGHAGHALVRNCAVIAFLLFSIYGLWGVYQAKQERLTLLQQKEDAKPKVIIVQARSDSASTLVSRDQ